MRALDLFKEQLSAWGLDVCPQTLERLTAYAGMLAGYERANIIGTRDPDRVLLDHVLDSISCLLFAPAHSAGLIADVGSGGGLPGIPLGITLSEARIVLFESTGKKVDFLASAIEGLQLDRAQAIKTRVEEAGHQDAHRSRYDLCTVRAVARLSVVVEYCVPLIRVGGHVIAMKGRPGADEIQEGVRAADTVGARLREVIEVPMLSEIGEKERRLIVLEKVRRTPDRYPRKPGTPAKSPLGGA